MVTSLLLQKATRRRYAVERAAMVYDQEMHMSRFDGPDMVLAIESDERPRPPKTKKFDVERGEDVKDRW